MELKQTPAGIALLQRAANEIKCLRNENKIMAARLDTFDKMIAVFNAQPERQGGAFSPDVIYEIEKHITDELSKPQP